LINLAVFCYSVNAEGLMQEDCDNESNIQDYMTSPRSINSFESVENLLLNLTNVGRTTGNGVGSTPDIGLPRVCSASALELSPIYPVDDVFEKRRKSMSSSNLPVAKYETAFGPENRTVTRVYFKDGVQTDYGYTNGPEKLSTTPIETHFKTSQELPPFLHRAEQCYDSYDVNFVRVRSMRRKKADTCKNAIEKNRRRSCDVNLQGQSNNCPENVKTNHFTKNKQYIPTRKSSCDSCREYGETRPSPEYVDPPSYKSLFPEGYKPIINGSSRKLLNRSVSSQALHMLRSLSYEDEDCQHSLNRQAYSQTLGRIQSRTSINNIYCPPLTRKHSQGSLNSCAFSQNMNRMESKESLNGRSLSLTDLLHGEPRPQLRRCASDASKSHYTFVKRF
jgi:hypothetical protein